jgi:hypothetical protein
MIFQEHHHFPIIFPDIFPGTACEKSGPGLGQFHVFCDASGLGAEEVIGS